MSTTSDPVDPQVKAFIQKIASEGIHHAVGGLSDMVGENLTAAEPRISFVPLLEIPYQVGGPENEVVGIYLRAIGDLPGQFMLIMPYIKALEMIDMILGEPRGTTTELEGMGRSALAEVGNLTGAYFLNALAAATNRTTTLTPPAVMFDMVGAILNIIVAGALDIVENVVVIGTNIQQGNREVQADFWYVPDIQALQAFNDLSQ